MLPGWHLGFKRLPLRGAFSVLAWLGGATLGVGGSGC